MAKYYWRFLTPSIYIGVFDSPNVYQTLFALQTFNSYSLYKKLDQLFVFVRCKKVYKYVNFIVNLNFQSNEASQGSGIVERIVQLALLLNNIAVSHEFQLPFFLSATPLEDSASFIKIANPSYVQVNYFKLTDKFIVRK